MSWLFGKKKTAQPKTQLPPGGPPSVRRSRLYFFHQILFFPPNPFFPQEYKRDDHVDIISSLTYLCLLFLLFFSHSHISSHHRFHIRLPKSSFQWVVVFLIFPQAAAAAAAAARRVVAATAAAVVQAEQMICMV